MFARLISCQPLEAAHGTPDRKRLADVDIDVCATFVTLESAPARHRRHNIIYCDGGPPSPLPPPPAAAVVVVVRPSTLRSFSSAPLALHAPVFWGTKANYLQSNDSISISGQKGAAAPFVRSFLAGQRYTYLIRATAVYVHTTTRCYSGEKGRYDTKTCTLPECHPTLVCRQTTRRRNNKILTSVNSASTSDCILSPVNTGFAFNLSFKIFPNQKKDGNRFNLV